MQKTISLLIISFSIVFTCCSDNCDGENPIVQLFNNGTGKADIQIKTSGGNTENINNIEPGFYSGKRSFSPGEIEFTIAINGVDDPIEYFLIINFCTEYLILINDDNTVTSMGIRLDYL